MVSIRVSENTVKVALVPLNVTEVAPVKPEPLIVTGVLSEPLVGENAVITGPGRENSNASPSFSSGWLSLSTPRATR